MSVPTFLIVDDDAIIRLVIRRTLARHDPHALVFSAGSVAEARQQLTHTTPHIVITDYHLTDGTGLDVLAAAQALAPMPASVVISGDTARKAAVLAAGAVAFLAKPFGPNDLLDLLGTLGLLPT
ncbi:MAG: response regulator [Chloroflexota bacterium]|nr:response regulator [Chloroflexota bacterium]PLS77075.1 MAG: hypothetical protein CYG59_25770 [Chloroflexota bacterium]